MIRVICFDKKTGTLRSGNEELLAGDLPAATDGFVWVDFDRDDPQAERRMMEQKFGISALAVDDALRARHPPKIEWFDDYFFLLLKGFTAETDSIDFEIVHISFLVGANFIITRHALASPSVDSVWQTTLDQDLAVQRGPKYLCYRIIRTIIERYAPIVLGLEARLEELEDIMLDAPSDSVLAELMNYNSQLKKLRRIFGYQQACLAALEGGRQHAGRDMDGTEHEFQDVREQMERLASLSGLLQELTRDLMDGYISISSHRLNNIMKILTIASVIFLPLTFLAGIYGMNFEHMPELHAEAGYYILLGLMGVIAAVLLYLFRKMHWL